MSQERPSRPVRATVAEKRRASERLKEEPVSKRRVSTPKIEKSKPKAIPVPTPETPVKEDIVIILPTKITEGKPLPILKEPQPNTLSDSEYQSLAESGVLAASVARSRQKWLHDGFFEKYWSKAVYRSKKNMTEDEKKAEAEGKAQTKVPRPTMTKAGTCKLIVEPHVFDVTLYTVKDPSPQPQQFVPYGPPYVSPATPTPTYNSSPFRHSPLQQAPSTPSQQTTTRPPSQNSHQALPPQNNHQVPHPQNSHQAPPPQNSHQAPPPQNNHQTPPTSNPQTSVTPTTQKSSTTAVQSTSNPKSQLQAQQQRPDPVIHMLAQRAATDQELKGVMTIVATGKASSSQLEFFQKHIDELTKIARANEEAEARKRATTAAAAAAVAMTPVVQQPTPPASSPTAPVVPASAPTPTTQPQQQPSKENQQKPKSPVATPSSTPSSSQHHHPPAVQTPQPPTTVPPPQHPRSPHPNQYTYQHTTTSKPPRAPPAPLHVLLEFAANPVDRFLFPRYSILEYLPGFRSCLASFLIVRKIKASSLAGSTSGSGCSTPAGGGNTSKDTSDNHGGSRKKGVVGKKEEEKEEEREVYQPVTVRFRAGDTHTLGILAKVVAPLEEVRAYMEGVMSRCERAEEGFLALRLPRRKGGVGVDGVEE